MGKYTEFTERDLAGLKAAEVVLDHVTSLYSEAGGELAPSELEELEDLVVAAAGLTRDALAQRADISEFPAWTHGRPVIYRGVGQYLLDFDLDDDDTWIEFLIPQRDGYWSVGLKPDRKTAKYVIAWRWRPNAGEHTEGTMSLEYETALAIFGVLWSRKAKPSLTVTEKIGEMWPVSNEQRQLAQDTLDATH
jgi:hypothetical protein